MVLHIGGIAVIDILQDLGEFWTNLWYSFTSNVAGSPVWWLARESQILGPQEYLIRRIYNIRESSNMKTVNLCESSGFSLDLFIDGALVCFFLLNVMIGINHADRPLCDPSLPISWEGGRARKILYTFSNCMLINMFVRELKANCFEIICRKRR